MRAPDRPASICENCWRSWRAIAPPARDPLLICIHRRAAARLLPGDTWELMTDVTPAEVRQLRGLPPIERAPRKVSEPW